MRVGAGGMVLTPSVEDIVLAHRVPRVREAYRRVSMSLLDSVSLGWIARLGGVRLPERMTKTAFLHPLMDLAVAEGWGVFLVGPCEESAIPAVERLESTHPGLRVVGTDCSVWRGAPDHTLVRRIQLSGARLILVSLPSPQQEMWMLQHSAMLAPAITFGIGESVEVLGRRSAPRAGVVARLGRAIQTLRVLNVLLQWKFSKPKPTPATPARPMTPVQPGAAVRRNSGSVRRVTPPVGVRVVSSGP